MGDPEVEEVNKEIAAKAEAESKGRKRKHDEVEEVNTSAMFSDSVMPNTSGSRGFKAFFASRSGPWKRRQRSVEELKDDINSLKEWNEKMARFKSKYGIAVMEKFKFIGIILVRTKNVPDLEDDAMNAETQKASEYIESSPSGDALKEGNAAS